MATFDYQDDKNGPIKTYSKPVEFPETCPMLFHAINQFAFHVAWVEKNALKARIEELESILIKSMLSNRIEPKCEKHNEPLIAFDCHHCHGEGEVDGSTCRPCSGSGYDMCCESCVEEAGGK